MSFILVLVLAYALVQYLVVMPLIIALWKDCIDEKNISRGKKRAKIH